MIRSCVNCKNFRKIDGQAKMGYCHLQPTMFAYTMEKNVYDIKMSFYLCESHEFTNENWLHDNAESVDLKSILVNKENINDF